MRCLTQSSKIRAEYCCQVVRVGKMEPIANSDFLAKTVVAGNTIVIRKDEFKEGDIALYAKNETVLNQGFLSANNLYDISEFERNNNADIVRSLLNGGNKEEAKKKVGFFNKYGRVKSLKLKGIYSMGFIFSVETLAKWKPEVASDDMSKYIINEEMGIGEDFDTVCGEEFVKVYIPQSNKMHKSSSGRNERKRQKAVKRFERISDSDWKFHYDTLKANDNIWMINPGDVVCLSVKQHGTSGIFGNIKIKYPSKLSIRHKICNYVARKAFDLYKWLNKFTVPIYYEDFGNVYSSRGVIKNKYINNSVSKGFYGKDIWSDINDILSPYIEKGMIVYGEICGYISGKNTFIQKQYDYGCNIGENFFMPYRIITNEEDGTTKEWNVDDIVRWTNKLLQEHEELKGKVRPMTILYHGTLSDLYPNVPLDEHWHENILNEMKNDTGRLGLEKPEPLCKNKVPREGICIRIDNRPDVKAMKLKSNLFYERERKAIDKGEIDIETANTYGDDINNNENNNL